MLNKIHRRIGYALSALLVFTSCNRPDAESQRPSFKQVEGINFLEVHREFENGLSFNRHGFQQIPEWNLYFLPGDSVKIYSPFEKRYIHYPIYFDHGQVINFAREWLRLKHVSKDSLVLQLLRVKSREIDKKLSNVYMRFYSEAYVRDVLRSNPDSLRRPKLRDTLFIKSLVKRAKANPTTPDSLFSARSPVVLRSKIDWITVRSEKPSKGDLNYKASDEYMNVEYHVEIKKAYKNFSRSFTAFVDDKGKITVGKFANIEKDFEAPQRRVLQGITDVYLQRFLEITPGKTLGMPHPTEIMLYVRGTKD